MLDWIEARFAQWTGKGQWPYITGRVESHLDIPDGQIRDRRTSHYSILSYNVDGKIYTAAIRDIAGQGKRAAHKGGSVPIQYKPGKPSEYYFAPACKLAGRFVAGLIMLAGVAAIVVAVRSAR